MANIPFDTGPSPTGVIPLSVPEIHGNEWKYIERCLDTNWVSSAGSFVDRFEEVMAEYLGVDYAVATVNGTSALHLALLAAGIKADDEVLVPALTFVAPANAVRYIGAWPTFMDVEYKYRQMDPAKTLDFIENECHRQEGALYNKSTNRRVSAIMPVHLLGHPADMDPIMEIADKYGLVIIEDTAESLGAEYLGRRESKDSQWSKVGSRGDIACFSFNGNKIITAGGGGMMVTDNAEWARKAKYLATQAKDDPIEYIHEEIGYNYRLTNIQAAMGVAQMELLTEHIDAKMAIADRYRASLADLPGITVPEAADWARPIYWLYTILVDPATSGVNSRDLLRELRAVGIESRPFWRPIHTLAPFRSCVSYRVEAANKLYQEGLSLPSSVGLKQKEQGRVIEVIRNLGQT